MVLRLLEKIAGACGLHIATLAFIAGLALGALGTGAAALKIGGWIGAAHQRDLDAAQAELNDVKRELANAQRDRLAAEKRAAAAREQAQQNARAMVSAQEDRDGYRAELEQLAAATNAPGPDEELAPACPTKAVDLRCRAALPVDIGRLQRNHWQPVDSTDGSVPAQHE